MALFIAQSGGPVNMNVGQAQLDVIAISQIDGGVGFDETNTVVIEGVTCIPVSYAKSKAGPTSDRLDDLVNEISYASPPQIVIFAVQNPDAFTLSDGTPLKGNGFAFPVGNADNPFAANVCTLYDITLCGGDGMWCDQEGGGQVMITTETMLYHELSHCFHFVTGTTPVDGDGNFDSAQEEVNAEIDENDMRDVRGVPHRDVNSHDGGCGGGVDQCCIIASLSTGSAYSEEIKSFRRLREHTLRDSAVGDKFFQEFFHRYYAFSPEVTRLIGRKPSLGPAIRDRFVLPLLAGLETLICYADTRGVGLAELLRRQSKREDLAEIHQLSFLEGLSGHLAIARTLDAKAISQALTSEVEQYAGFQEVLQYVNKETIKDEYIDWSLVSVVEVWVNSAMLLHSHKSNAEINLEIYDRIIRWIALMPISAVWDDLSRLQTEMELRSLERFIFDPLSKQIFSSRLVEKHSRYSETIRRWANERR